MRPSGKRNCLGPVAAAITSLAATLPVARALTPDDIVVLFNTQSPGSLQVARKYIAARNLPPDHLLPVTCDGGETISEEAYRTQVTPQVQKWLTEHKLLAQTKCLVTTFDMPLRIAARQPAPKEKLEIADFEKQLAVTLDAIERELPAFDAIAPEPAATAPATTRPAEPRPTEPRTWQSVVVKINTASSNAGRRLEKLPLSDRAPALLEFLKVQERVAGGAGLLASLRITPDAPGADATRRQLEALATRNRDLDNEYAMLERQRSSPDVRREMIAVREKSAALVGRGRALAELIAYLKPDATESCFDNELALVLSDVPYSRSNWQINPLNIEFYPTIQRMPATQVPRTLMVCRLDGLTVAQTLAMIDTTLKTEAAGLEGKLYLDARGLHGTDAYAIYDADIRRAAAWLKEHAAIETVLDDTPELFKEKDAPDAALYCGWYALRGYFPTARWVQGAVGYHVASLEMMTMHDPKEPGWVPNLLSHGLCGTMGATDEPYLSSFPKPSQFFPLLLSGEFTQGEVWQVTSPMLSWRVGFVGDPLYNPYQKKPRVKIDDLKADTVLRNAFTILRADKVPK